MPTCSFGLPVAQIRRARSEADGHLVAVADRTAAELGQDPTAALLLRFGTRVIGPAEVDPRLPLPVEKSRSLSIEEAVVVGATFAEQGARFHLARAARRSELPLAEKFPLLGVDHIVDQRVVRSFHTPSRSRNSVGRSPTVRIEGASDPQITHTHLPETTAARDTRPAPTLLRRSIETSIERSAGMSFSSRHTCLSACAFQTMSKSSPPSPDSDSREIEEKADVWWHSGDFARIRLACSRLPPAEISQRPQVARWSAIAMAMDQRGEWSFYLESAFEANLALGDQVQASLDAHIALALCFIDISAMRSVTEWASRITSSNVVAPPERGQVVWWDLGRVALGVVDANHLPFARDAAVRLRRRLRPLAEPALAAHERVLAAQILIDLVHLDNRPEEFDLLAADVHASPAFESVHPLTRARWFYTLGFAQYQVARQEQALAAWKCAQEVCAGADLKIFGDMVALAQVRLHLDRDDVDSADVLLKSVGGIRGSGRESQLLELRQMEARLLTRQGRAIDAHRRICDALSYAKQAGFVAAEEASLRTDYVQVLISLGRTEEASAELERLCRTSHGRDATVFAILAHLWKAWQSCMSSEAKALQYLQLGLAEARRIQYDHFFRLLPELAGQLCDLACSNGIESEYVSSVVWLRDLPAPARPSAFWPWPVRVKVLGQFGLEIRGASWPGAADRGQKAPQKPLELMKLLACSDNMTRRIERVEVELWPGSNATKAQARKNFEVTVSRLREFLRDGSKRMVTVHAGTVSLDRHRVYCDLVEHDFHVNRLREIARGLVSQANGSDVVSSLSEAVEIASHLELNIGTTLLQHSEPTEWQEDPQTAFQRRCDLALNAAEAIYGASRGAESNAQASRLRSALMLSIEKLVR